MQSNSENNRFLCVASNMQYLAFVENLENPTFHVEKTLHIWQ
ncbi:hypothetical protein AM1_D0094 (plasmid) [Acaryochloris marina MBIC11017]|uniref:Uncharacterized protein n=1 Tax=Acaryochloris marina (strain MBIC 11017) TaxID=329726 RepID=A8ZNK3_ACAM1|nr:hypothetical protein AM1_D0094 [Acaryochloris marina MBIC11017]